MSKYEQRFIGPSQPSEEPGKEVVKSMNTFYGRDIK